MANALPRAHVADAHPIAANPCPNSSSDPISASTSELSPAPPTSRKGRRKQRKTNRTSGLPTPPPSDTESSPRTPPNNPPRKKQKQRTPQQPSPHPSSSPMLFGSNALTKASPLLVCSLGNPGSAYANTLHSAGHTVISKIANAKNYRAFQKGMSGLVSRPDNSTYSFALHKGFYPRDDAPPEEDDWTFWQSTSLMNASGPSVKKAWGHFVKEANKDMGEPRLVVVHDELEAPLGKVSVKEGSASPRGHNGLKSCQASLGNLKWWRIGVGIGRPESRDASVVSRYVLSKMGKTEMNAMDKAGPAVVAALREISEGKK